MKLTDILLEIDNLLPLIAGGLTGGLLRLLRVEPLVEGSGYAGGDGNTIDLTVPTFDPITCPVALRVAHVGIGNAGTGYVLGDQLYLEGDDGFVPFISLVKGKFRVGSVGGAGEILSITVYSGGTIYFVSLLGANSRVTTNNGNEFITPENPSYVGAGTGATFNGVSYSVSSFVPESPMAMPAGITVAPYVSVGVLGSSAFGRGLVSLGHVTGFEPGTLVTDDDFTTGSLSASVYYPGSGAAATPNVSGGQITSYTVTDRGSGYITPLNTFVGTLGDGTGATATTVMMTDSLDGLLTVDATKMTVAIAIGTELTIHTLVAGTDAEAEPSIVRPDDYAASTNEKVWKLAVRTKSTKPMVKNDTSLLWHTLGVKNAEDGSPLLYASDTGES